jgi:hypothetical protein
LQTDVEAIPPLTLSEDGVVVELPGMSTEPDQHQLQNAPKLCHICEGPFKGALLADAMGLGKSLTVAMTVMLSGKRAIGKRYMMMQSHFACRRLVADLPITHDCLRHPRWRLRLRDRQLWACGCPTRSVEDREYHAWAKDKGIGVANASQTSKKMPNRPILSLCSDVYEDTGRPFPFLVLDEVQYVKHPASKTHIAIKELPYMAVICASGIRRGRLPRWTSVRYGARVCPSVHHSLR